MRLILNKKIVGIRQDENNPSYTLYAMRGDRVKVIFNNTSGSVHKLDTLTGHFVCSNIGKENDFIVFPSQVQSVVIERESEIEELTDFIVDNNENYLINDDTLYSE
jgi:hypothetical protein